MDGNGIRNDLEEAARAAKRFSSDGDDLVASGTVFGDGETVRYYGVA